MSDYSKVVVTGRLTRDAEMKTLASGTIVVDFSVASNRRINKDKEETAFVDCSLFGERAEKILPYLTKGKKILVDGKLRQETWEKDGQKRSKLSILVDEVSFLSSDNTEGQTPVTIAEPQTKELEVNLDSEVPF